MYDMYPWDEHSAGRGDDPPRPPRSWGDPSPQTPLGGESSPKTLLGGDNSPQIPLVQAVQIALDWRDNGGDGVSAAGQPTDSRTRQ